MMDFVLGHQAEPLPESDCRAVGRYALAEEVGVGERTENLHGFVMKEVDVREHGVVTVGQFARVAGIAAWEEARVFAPHVTLGAGKVSEEIAEGEAAGLERPFELIGRDAFCDAEGAGANFFEVVEELGDVGILWWVDLGGHGNSIVSDDVTCGGDSAARNNKIGLGINAHFLFRRGEIYGGGVLIDELAAAVGADDGEDGERDEACEKDAAKAGGEVAALRETEDAESEREAGCDEHDGFVDFEDVLYMWEFGDGGLREPSRCGCDEAAEGAEIEEADGGAVPIVARAPDGEGFVEKRGEPQRDGKMDEERMVIQHGFHSGEHGGSSKIIVAA